MPYETEAKQETVCDLSEYIEDTVIKQYQKEFTNV